MKELTTMQQIQWSFALKLTRCSILKSAKIFFYAIEILIFDVTALMRQQNNLRALVGHLFDRGRTCADALDGLERIGGSVDGLVHINAAEHGLALQLVFVKGMNAKSHGKSLLVLL